MSGERPVEGLAGWSPVEGPAGRSAEARIERVDDRLGLAISRVGLSARTLVTYARDHVTVRTPSRSDFLDGNTIDLLQPPAADDLPGWVERFHDTIGVLGASHVQVRWEESVAPGTPPNAPTPDPDVAVACQQLGFELEATIVLLLEELAAPTAGAPAQLVAVEAPSAVPGGAVDRRWHAATVLYRYAAGDTPDEWRNVDQSFVDWSVDVQRELASADRCQVWVAMRHGGPAARLTMLHDRQGLAAIEDVIVHPVHRRIGLASALTHRAITAHLQVDVDARVGVGAEPGSGADALYRRLGFRPHAVVWTARRRPAGNGNVSGRTAPG